MKKARKSAPLTVAKNLDKMIGIDQAVGLEFEIIKTGDEVTFKAITGTRSITYEEFNFQVSNLKKILKRKEVADKSIVTMIKFQGEDYRYAAVLFTHLKNKLGSDINHIKSTQVVCDDNSKYATWHFTTFEEEKFTIVMDNEVLTSVITKSN